MIEEYLFSNPNFRVGEKVLYKIRDRVYIATILSFIGSEIAVIEMENGANRKTIFERPC